MFVEGAKGRDGPETEGKKKSNSGLGTAGGRQCFHTPAVTQVAPDYFDFTKNPLDRALPPPATTSMNVMPALTLGTVASMVVSLTNL